jgi:hypothetical protein
MHVDQGRDQWRGVVNKALNLLVPEKVGNFFTS